MDIIQKNIFGNNTVYIIPPNYVRTLDDKLKKEISGVIQNLGVNSATIRYENGGETKEFSETVKKFLIEWGLHNVNLMPVLMSEIERNEFSIQVNPGDQNWAIIKIGPTI